jgi:hypothetical protein
VIVAGAPQPAMAPAAVLPRSHPTVDARGIVASVDHQNGIITFQDGRMVRVTNDGRVWQSGNVVLGSVQPGSEVFVSNAVPMGYRAAGTSYTWAEHDLMGQVISVNESGSQILLSNGTVVAVSPSTRMQMAGGRSVSMAELKPGDQIVVHARPVAPASAQVITPASTAVVDTVPRSSWPGYQAVIEADQIIVIRLTQAP